LRGSSGALRPVSGILKGASWSSTFRHPDIQTDRQTERKGVLRHRVKTTGRAIKPFKSNGRTNWFPSSRKLYEVL